MRNHTAKEGMRLLDGTQQVHRPPGAETEIRYSRFHRDTRDTAKYPGKPVGQTRLEPSLLGAPTSAINYIGPRALLLLQKLRNTLRWMLQVRIKHQPKSPPACP